LPLELSADEVAFFEDEGDGNRKPRKGSMCMRRGQQTEVWTPRTNAKRDLAGSMNWRTGEVVLSGTGYQAARRSVPAASG
jgi:hypothetical protein